MLGISALASALDTQKMMGQLLVDMLSMSTDAATQTAKIALQQTVHANANAVISGLGENIDVTA